jgi:hypothetical protein
VPKPTPCEFCGAPGPHGRKTLIRKKADSYDGTLVTYARICPACYFAGKDRAMRAALSPLLPPPPSARQRELELPTPLRGKKPDDQV